MDLHDEWREANETGSALVHHTGIWVLVYLDDDVAPSQPGWFLWGPDANRDLMGIDRETALRMVGAHVAKAYTTLGEFGFPVEQLSLEARQQLIEDSRATVVDALIPVDDGD